jgi:hypothetical protein
MTITKRHRLSLVAILLGGMIGCGGPNKTNVELRKKNQLLQDEVKTLKQQHEGDVASLAAKDKQAGSLPTLSNDRLNQLFTVTKIDIASLSAIREGGLKVYVTPRDADGDPLKTAGAIAVDAFDLSKPDKPQLGHWDFPATDAGKNWYESIVVRGYALTCPLQVPPTGSEITVRVTFTDSLTQRVLTAQKVITAPAAPATQPSGK